MFSANTIMVKSCHLCSEHDYSIDFSSCQAHLSQWQVGDVFILLIRTQRRFNKGTLEKLSFPSLKNRENPWFYWVFRVFLCTLRDGFLAVFSQISRKFLAVFSQFPKSFEPILNWFGDYLGLFNSLRRHIEAVITRLSWKLLVFIVEIFR